MPAFNLSRYFLTLSLIIIVLAGGMLGIYFRHHALSQMVADTHDHNVSMTRVFRNALWQRIAGFVDASYGRDAATLRQTVAEHSLHEATTALMRQTEVIKVKLYNRDGLTIFSTDPRQIGEDQQDNKGFQTALAGQPISELIHRNEFDSFEGRRNDLDAVFSYVPIVPGIEAKDAAKVMKYTAEKYHE